MTPPLLDVRDLSVDYPTGAGRTTFRAVDDVTLGVDAGRTLGVVGASGSGKSTVGAAILGFAPASSGRIRFDGEDITHCRGAARRRLSRQLQIVFQDPYNSLNTARTIGDTLAEPLRYNLGLPPEQASKRVRQLLDHVGLPIAAAARYPAEFSGGQRQRIAIARAIAMRPRLVICDEPVSALDLSVQAQVLNLLRDLQDEFGMAYLFISHDLAVVRHVAHDIAVMRGGRIVERGPAAHVYATPEHPYTRQLLLAAPVPDPSAQRRRREERRALADTHREPVQLEEP